MGCSASKLEDQETVQLCRDRKNFINQAVEQRMRFTAGHIAYIQSLRRLSLALCNYVDGDEHHDFYMDSYMTPGKRLSPEVVGVHLKSFTPSQNQSEKSTDHVVNYLRSAREPSVAVEECPKLSETIRIESYYSMDHYNIDGFFATQASTMHSSFFSSPYNRPSHPPPSRQTSQLDFFWDPFSSLDPYGYPSSDGLDQIVRDDEMASIRQVREEEEIAELEEEGGEEENKYDEKTRQVENKDETSKVDSKVMKVAIAGEGPAVVNGVTEVHRVSEVQTQGTESIEISEAQNAVEHMVTNEQAVVGNREGTEKTPGFTVYVNRRPNSIAEFMKDVDFQFMRICDAAHEVSLMLEVVSRAQHSSTSSELAAIKMLNPIALFHSASSRSSSSRFLQASSSSRDDADESSSDYSEESCMTSGSHQLTLDRLYAWENKLYEEVKYGERIRIAYEKKCMQLRNHNVNGEEPSVDDKTRAAITDLHNRLQVSIHTVESVSNRIEKLRDEELHPQLVELIQGLATMWRTIADCHRIQKRTIDEAKPLLFSASVAALKPFDATSPGPSRYAANLEAELRQWRSCLEAWVDAQRSYARALAGWIGRCARSQYGGAARSPLSPGRSRRGSVPPVYRICVCWSRLLESASEVRAVEGVEFFEAGIGSVCGQQREGPSVAEVSPEEVAARALCAIGDLAEFAGELAEGYEALVKRCLDGGTDGSGQM